MDQAQRKSQWKFIQTKQCENLRNNIAWVIFTLCHVCVLCMCTIVHVYVHTRTSIETTTVKHIRNGIFASIALYYLDCNHHHNLCSCVCARCMDPLLLLCWIDFWFWLCEREKKNTLLIMLKKLKKCAQDTQFKCTSFHRQKMLIWYHPNDNFHPHWWNVVIHMHIYIWHRSTQISRCGFLLHIVVPWQSISMLLLNSECSEAHLSRERRF